MAGREGFPFHAIDGYATHAVRLQSVGVCDSGPAQTGKARVFRVWLERGGDDGVDHRGRGVHAKPSGDADHKPHDAAAHHAAD